MSSLPGMMCFDPLASVDWGRKLTACSVNKEPALGLEMQEANDRRLFTPIPI